MGFRARSRRDATYAADEVLDVVEVEGGIETVSTSLTLPLRVKTSPDKVLAQYG